MKQIQINKMADGRTSNGSLCGMPGFCAKTSYNACSSIPLYKCDECSLQGAGFVVAILIIIALCIVVGNSMVISSVFCNGNRGKTKLGFVKASLAVADLINGFHLFCVVIPNIMWTLSVNPQQLHSAQIFPKNLPSSVAGSFFFGLTYVASIDHLSLLAVHRWIAIKWPFWWRAKDSLGTLIWLALIWIASIATCLIPILCQDIFIISYMANFFLFVYNFSSDEKYVKTIEICIMVLFVVVPFIIMTIFSTWTGVIVCVTSRKSKSMRLERDRAKLIKNEIAVCKSLLLMVLGFVFTLLPGTIWLVLFSTGQISCEDSSVPLLVGLILCSSNSLVNVIVYSFRDENFIEISRKLVAVILCRQTSSVLRKSETRKLQNNNSRAENKTDDGAETRWRK